MTVKQLYLWDHHLPEPYIAEMGELRASQDKLRRGIFQRYGDLKKEIHFLREEMEFLKSELEGKKVNAKHEKIA